MSKIILSSILLLCIFAVTCTTINMQPSGNPECPNCEKFEDLGYQKVIVLTNTGRLPDDEFKAYVLKRASFYNYTRIRYVWEYMLAREFMLREAIIYYER